MCLSKGQQTLSEEVSERTRSRMLKLEKENQSLLRTIEELRATVNNSTQTKHIRQAVCSSNNSTSSTDQPSVFHISTENHTDVFNHSTVTQQMVNGDSSCHQQLHTEQLERVQSEILLTDNPDLHIQEKGQLEDGGGGDSFKDIMSDLEVLENNHNRLHCFVGSCVHSPGSRSSSPCHESVFTGLPTRSSYASKHTQRLEAKCRNLETVNQHLQTSLDNTGRLCESIKHLICSHIMQQFLIKEYVYSIVFHLLRPKSSASGGRGSGAGGGEPQFASHLRGTADICETSGATRNREAGLGA